MQRLIPRKKENPQANTKNFMKEIQIPSRSLPVAHEADLVVVGGGPSGIATAVAAAVGLAVLDVIRDQGLMENAASVGADFALGLRALGSRHAALGETRAAGLFIGQTILTDGKPDPVRTARLVNALRDEHILISSTGPKGDSLKIRPPLPFSLANVDQVLTTLDRLLPTL